jgi:bifunctional non-homologous end joining protein LigD
VGRGAGARRTRQPGSDTLQLDLDLLPADAAPLPPATWLRPRAPTEAGAPFDDPDRFFEPWWPGAIVHVHVASQGIHIHTPDLAEAVAAFPELSGLASQVGAVDAVLEGTLMVLDDLGRPDAALLRRRLGDPRSLPGEGAFVASDLLAVGGAALTGEPFAKRRSRLLDVLADGPHCVASRGLRGEGVTLARAVADMGLVAVSARRLDAPWRPGAAGDDWLRLPVTEPPAAERKPLLVLLRRLPLD